VIKAYEAYWNALLAASDPANPADRKLSKVAIEPELDRAHRLLTARKTAGEVVRGHYHHKERVVAIGDADAQLTDCLSMKINVFDAQTKKLKHPEPTGPFPVSIKLKLDGRSWKVADISAGNQNCLSTAPPPIPSTSPTTK
jgi:YD repeat-containing protein